MAQEGKIGITIDRKIWKELVKIRLDNDLRTFDEIILWLLKKAKCNSLEKKALGGKNG